MWLIPAAVTVLLMGVTPVGETLARDLTSDPDRQWVTLLICTGLCLLITGSPGWLLGIWKREAWQDKRFPRNSWWALGENCGQGSLFGILLATVVVAAGAVLVDVYLFGAPRPSWSAWSRLDVTRLGLTVGLTATTLIVSAPIFRSHWPPTLPRIDEAELPKLLDETTLYEVQRDVPDDPDAIVHSFSPTFQSAWSSRGESRGSHRYTIRPWVHKLAYEEFLGRDHPHPDRSPEGPAVLAQYVREGIHKDVRACAGLLWKKAGRLHLREFERADFVLSFVSAIGGGSQQTPAQADGRFAKFPIETLHEECGTPQDRTFLAAALLKVMLVDPLLVIAKEKNELRVGLGLPLTAGAAAASKDVIEFEHKRYVYCHCLPNGKWRFGKQPKDPLLIPLEKQETGSHFPDASHPTFELLNH
jgi:hypothetical protein